MSKAYQHVNRRGDAYFLQSKTGKSGQPIYSFARKLTRSSVDNKCPMDTNRARYPNAGR